jgi:peroxiredoxin
MTDQTQAENRIILGDRVPWFSAPLVTGGSFDLHVSAGRWVVLSFLGSPANPRAQAELAALVSQADVFKEDHLVMGCVFTGPPEDVAKLAAIGSNALFFVADYDGAISRSFGAAEMPRTIVLDPMLRAVADIAWDIPQGPCRNHPRRAARSSGGG